MKIIKTEFIKGNTEFYDFDISIVFLNEDNSDKSGYYMIFLPIFKYNNHFDKLNDSKIGRQLSSNIQEDDEKLYKILQNRDNLYLKYIKDIEKTLKEKHLKLYFKQNCIKADNLSNSKLDDCIKINNKEFKDIENKRVSYHEAGHALVGIITKIIPMDKISIIPREDSLGHISNQLNKKQFLYTETELFNKIKFLLAGKVSEKIVFNEHSTGCYDDLKQSSIIAMDMVCKYSMGDNDCIFINPLDNATLTDSTIKKIENLLIKANNEVSEILKTHINELHLIANELFIKKELDIYYIEQLINTMK